MTVAATRALGAVLAGAVLAACGDEVAGVPARDPDLLLEVDGLRLSRAEFDPLDAALAELDPKLGRKFRRRTLLEQHFVPLLLARRAFADRRTAMLERAEGLATVAGNALDLAARSTTAGGFRPDEPLYRNDLPLAVMLWAFRAENIGAASPPIEVPRGFVMIGVEELEAGITRMRDRIHASIVPFMTHDPAEFDPWLRESTAALRGRVTYVHPDLEGALPEWLTD